MVRGPTLPERPEDPDNANPARQPGLQHVNRQKSELRQSEPGPTVDPPWPHRMAKKNDLQSKTAGRYLCAARDLNPEPAD
jgi:hypothetical protein